jgi:cytochrome c biogenesis factor
MMMAGGLLAMSDRRYRVRQGVTQGSLAAAEGSTA